MGFFVSNQNFKQLITVKCHICMILPKNLRTRIAPTPSGFLHIGNAFSFVLTWLIARKTNGYLQLRIDDSDEARTKTEYITDIFESLHWLGIDYDSGAKNLHDFQQNYSQTKKADFYTIFLKKLIQNKCMYACSCSRSEIKKYSLSGKYNGFCRNKFLSLDTENTALRIQIPDAETIKIHEFLQPEKSIFLPQITDDFVIRRKDKIMAYQLISVAEDTAERINFVVRGRDLEDSTARQLFLANQLGLPIFQNAIFWHHPLIINAKGDKLAKSAGDISLRQMRENGVNPSKIYQIIAQFLGIKSNKNITLVELIEKFELKQDFVCPTQNFNVSSSLF